MNWTPEREQQATEALREYLRDKFAPGDVNEGLDSLALGYIKKTESERYGAFVTMEACIDAINALPNAAEIKTRINEATARRIGNHFNRIVLG